MIYSNTLNVTLIDFIKEKLMGSAINNSGLILINLSYNCY